MAATVQAHKSPVLLGSATPVFAFAFAIPRWCLAFVAAANFHLNHGSPVIAPITGNLPSSTLTFHRQEL